MPLTAESVKELERLVELDYERSSSFIQALVGSSTAIRGLAITLWVALIGFAIGNHEALLAVLAVLSVFVFATLDVYYSALDEATKRRATELEAVTALYFRSISLGRFDSDLGPTLERKLTEHAFGFFTHLAKAHAKDMIKQLPRTFIGVYIFLVIVGIGSSLLILLSPAVVPQD